MSDSDGRDDLEAKRGRNRQQRIEAVKCWVEYIKTQDVEDWDKQQNRLVNSQLESVRQSKIDIEHRQRVDRAGHNRSGES